MYSFSYACTYLLVVCAYFFSLSFALPVSYRTSTVLGRYVDPVITEPSLDYSQQFLFYPWGVYVNANNEYYVSERSSHIVRVFGPDGSTHIYACMALFETVIFVDLHTSITNK